MLIAAFEFTFEGKLYKKGAVLPDSLSNLAGAKFVESVDTLKSSVKEEKKVESVPKKVEIKKQIKAVKKPKKR